MEVRNCRKCGRVFNYVAGARLCQKCREELEEKFQEVKNYIRENKGAGIQEVSEACEVEVPQIHQWVREERLVFSEDSAIFFNCEKCGAPIRTGRFCDKCKAEMTNTFSNAIRQKPSPVKERQKSDKENPRMRYLDR